MSTEKLNFSNTRDGLQLKKENTNGKLTIGQPFSEISLVSKDNCDLRLDEIQLRSKRDLHVEEQIAPKLNLIVPERSGSNRNTNIVNRFDSKDAPRTPNAGNYKSALASSSQSKLRYSSSKYTPQNFTVDQNKTVSTITEQLENLKKQLNKKERDHSKDKAVWRQKEHMAEKEVQDLRHMMEN